MAVREIPKAFEYVCDLCGAVHRQENASGHYSNSRPPYWISVNVGADAHDFQGAAVADASVKRLLCDKCGPRVVAAINLVKP